MALEITDATFNDVVLKSDKPVLVDFWAEWCGPCRMVGPIIDEISNEFEGKAVVGKVDVDNNHEFASKFGVRIFQQYCFLKMGSSLTEKLVYHPNLFMFQQLRIICKHSIQRLRI